MVLIFFVNVSQSIQLHCRDQMLQRLNPTMLVVLETVFTLAAGITLQATGITQGPPSSIFQPKQQGSRDCRFDESERDVRRDQAHGRAPNWDPEGPNPRFRTQIRRTVGGIVTLTRL